MHSKSRPAGIALVIGVLLGSSVLIACGSEEERLAEYTQRANAYYEEERWSEAKIEFLNVLQIDSEDADANYKLAQTQLNLQEYGDALWRFQEAVRLNPENDEWRLRLARFLLLARRSELVLENVDVILERDPENVDALLLRSRVLADRGDPEGAMRAIEQILEMDDVRPEALAMQAQLLVRLENLDGAEAALRKLVESEKSAASYLLLGGFLSGQRRDQTQGIAMYEKALEVAEETSQRLQIHLLIANYHIGQSDHARAETALLAAKQEDPTNASLLVQLAQFYVFQDKLNAAQALLQENVDNHPESAGPLLTLAEFHQRQGQPDEALGAVDRALEIEPGSEQARLQRAQYLMERRSRDPDAETEARDLLASVLEQNPNSLNGLFTDAKFLLVDQKYEEAILRLRRVVEEQPSANAHFLLGSAYLQLQELELARAELVQTLQLDANHHLARTQLAALYLRNNNRQLALQEATAALKSTPEDPRLLLIQSNAYVGLQQPDDAMKSLAKIDFDDAPDPRGFRMEAAALYQRLRRVEESRDLLHAVLEENPADASALRSLMRTEIQAGQPQVLLPRIDAAIETDPENAALYELRGGIRMGFQSKDGFVYGEQANADLKRAIELEPTRPEPYALLGRMAQMRKQSDEAIGYYQKAVEHGPANSAYYLSLGGLYQALGRDEDAASLYEKLLEVDPENPLAKNNLAWLLAVRVSASSGELDRALELAQDAKERLPENPAIADTLGFVMLKKDIPGAAISLFKEAVAGYRVGTPGRATARYHLGLAYERNGELERAVAEIESALGEAPFDDREEAETALNRLKNS